MLITVLDATGLAGIPSLMSSILLSLDPTHRRNSSGGDGDTAGPPPATSHIPRQVLSTCLVCLRMLGNLGRLSLATLQGRLSEAGIALEWHHASAFLLSHLSSVLQEGSMVTASSKEAAQAKAQELKLCEALLAEFLLVIGYIVFKVGGRMP